MTPSLPFDCAIASFVVECIVFASIRGDEIFSNTKAPLDFSDFSYERIPKDTSHTRITTVLLTKGIQSSFFIKAYRSA